MGGKVNPGIQGGELQAFLETKFPMTTGRLRRFRPYGRSELEALLGVAVEPGPQVTLHAFPGLRIGDHQVPPKFLRVSRGQIGTEVFRESDSGIKNVRILSKDEIVQYYYDLVVAGYTQAELELTLNSDFPPAIVRGLKRDAPVVEPRRG